jgi:uncharacterized membrane protein
MRNDTHAEMVRRYLDELDAALAERNVAERPDIVASVREHIESALGEGETNDDDVQRVLASLGDPLAIAAEAGNEESQARPIDETRGTLSRTWVPPVTIGLIMLSTATLFFYLPVVTLLLGLVLLWASSLWTVGEKLLGTFLLPLPGVAWLVALGAFFVTVEVCTSESAEVEVGSGQTPEVVEVCTGGVPVWQSILATGLLVAAVVAGIAAAVVLCRRGMSRAR